MVSARASLAGAPSGLAAPLPGRSGTSRIVPHCGHRAFFPRLSSGVLSSRRHPLQLNSMGITSPTSCGFRGIWDRTTRPECGASADHAGGHERPECSIRPAAQVYRGCSLRTRFPWKNGRFLRLFRTLTVHDSQGYTERLARRVRPPEKPALLCRGGWAPTRPAGSHTKSLIAKRVGEICPCPAPASSS